VNRVARTKGGNPAAPNGGEGRPDSTKAEVVSSEEEVRQRAYAIHLERGGEHGQDLDDWLRAERELKRVKGMIRDSEDSAD
jgi:hypothetical protein